MKEYKLYGLIVGLTVTIMIVCDTLVYKVIDVYGFKITASGVIFSLSYILSTISTEVYGYKLGGRTVWIIILCQSVFVILINLAVLIPETSPGTIGGHFYSIYNEFWKVMIGTWISVPASYFCNGYLISKIKHPAASYGVLTTLPKPPVFNWHALQAAGNSTLRD
jgi:uncharacterized PurR-regulated membrane protein YhhQ (DUF165 family)